MKPTKISIPNYLYNKAQPITQERHSFEQTMSEDDKVTYIMGNKEDENLNTKNTRI